MNAIHIKFQGDFADVWDVEAPVEVIDGQMETVEETTVALGGSKRIDNLKPGPYLVRATLPSGERLAASVSLSPDQTPSAPEPEAILISSESPGSGKRMSWPYAASKLSEPSPDAREKAVSFGRWEPNQTVLPIPIDAAYSLSFDLERGAWATASRKFECAVNTDFNEASGVSASYRLFNLQAAGSQEWSPCCLQIKTPNGDAQTIVIPPLNSAELLFLKGDDKMRRAFVRGNNPKAEALLSYMTQGNFSDARRTSEKLLAEASQMLFGKMEDPASAIIAAYYMLRAGKVTNPGWLRVLADHFSHIADGAVIYAWYLMRRAAPDMDEVREYFIQAIQRGIPCCTYGVRLLYDGLYMLTERNSEDREAHACFENFRAVARNADWGSQTTSILWQLPD